jgi:hypothetical protein
MVFSRVVCAAPALETLYHGERLFVNRAPEAERGFVARCPQRPSYRVVLYITNRKTDSCVTV